MKYLLLIVLALALTAWGLGAAAVASWMLSPLLKVFGF